MFLARRDFLDLTLLTLFLERGVTLLRFLTLDGTLFRHVPRLSTFLQGRHFRVFLSFVYPIMQGNPFLGL